MCDALGRSVVSGREIRVNAQSDGRKNVLERRILAVFSIHPYRCDECDGRFYRRARRSHTDKHKGVCPGTILNIFRRCFWLEIPPPVTRRVAAVDDSLGSFASRAPFLPFPLGTSGNFAPLSSRRDNSFGPS